MSISIQMDTLGLAQWIEIGWETCHLRRAVTATITAIITELCIYHHMFVLVQTEQSPSGLQVVKDGCAVLDCDAHA